MAAIFSQMARYYDRLGWSEFSESLFPLLMDFINKLPNHPSNYLDLACGTGVLAYKLASDHIQVTGVDLSPQMIAVAKAKRSTNNNKPRFILQDITKLKLNQKFDLAGCFFDSLNHLESITQLKNAFKKIAMHLNPNAWFIFDIITPLGLERWKPYVDSQEDIYQVHQNAVYDEKQIKALVKIEAHIKLDNNRTKHIKELFEEISLPTEDLKQLVIEAGFSKTIIKSFHPGITLENAERLMVYAKK